MIDLSFRGEIDKNYIHKKILTMDDYAFIALIDGLVVFASMCWFTGYKQKINKTEKPPEEIVNSTQG